MASNPSWFEARTLAHRCVTRLTSEVHTLEASMGYTLAEDLHSLTELPPAHTAMMDGYAVYGEPPWAVIGQVHAGQAAANIDLGQALRVSTGAHIPAKTSFVIPQEDAITQDDLVIGMSRQTERTHIRVPGDEAVKGELVLHAGTVITPAVAGVIATCGYDNIRVYPRPVVDVVVTGDELIERGPSRPGQIRDALGVQVPSWVEWAGGKVGAVIRTHDSQSELIRLMRTASAHIVMITGGSAHGPRDFVRPALADLGAELIIDEIDSKPAHPTVLAILPTGQIVVNLPGNPTAACVAFMTVVDPLMAALAGRDMRLLRSSTLSEPMNSDVTRIVPVTVRPNNTAMPTNYRNASMVRGLATADALAVVAPGEAVTSCGLLPLPWAQ